MAPERAAALQRVAFASQVLLSFMVTVVFFRIINWLRIDRNAGIISIIFTGACRSRDSTIT